MPWSAKFAVPFDLADGRKVATLADARTLVLALPERHQRNAHWLHAAKLLIDAAERSDKTSIAETRTQLYRAVKAEGLLA